MGSQDQVTSEETVLEHRCHKTTDMAIAACMVDHFERIQKLPDPVPGCPNFRRVPGYKVYCCGQPTLAGFEACLEKVCGTIYPKDGPIIWFNVRQEPDVYVNGTPVCARFLLRKGFFSTNGTETETLGLETFEFVTLKLFPSKHSAPTAASRFWICLSGWIGAETSHTNNT